MARRCIWPSIGRGHLLALHVAPADVGDREEGGRLAEAIQDVTGENVTLPYVDRGYTGENAAAAARAQGIEFQVARFPEAKHGFVLLPRSWVVERTLWLGDQISSIVRGL